MGSPLISVIIPTFNRAESLRETLMAMLAQTMQPSRFEVIVVDDGSTDETTRLVRTFAEEHPGFPLRYERHDTNRFRAAACNTGTRAARGELVVFTDDDIRPVPSWLEAHAQRHLAEPREVSVTGLVLYPPDWERASNWVKFANDNYRQNETLGRRHAGMLPPQRFAGGNTSLRRDLLIRAGMFDETMRRGQDGELACRLYEMHVPLLYEPAAVVYHYAEAILSIERTLKGFRRYYEIDRWIVRSKFPWYYQRFGHWFLEPVEHDDRLWQRAVKRMVRLVSQPALQRLAIRVLHAVDRRPLLHLRPLYQYVMTCEAVDAIRVSAARRGAPASAPAPARASAPTPAPATSAATLAAPSTAAATGAPPATTLAAGGRATAELDVSVIIATYNRCDSLVETLRSMAAQTYDRSRFEIIVVDDGSADATPDRVAAFAAEHPGLAVRYERHVVNKFKAAACNTGMILARGELVAFTDDDIRPVPGWLEALVRRCRSEPGAVSVIGLVEYPADWERASNWVRFANDNYRINVALSRSSPRGLPPNRFSGGNLCMRWDTLCRAGMFNESMRRGEDADLGCRLHEMNVPLLCEPLAVVYHYADAIRSIDQTLRAFRRFYEFDRALMEERYPWYPAQFGHWFLGPVDRTHDNLRRMVAKLFVRAVARRPLQWLVLQFLRLVDHVPWLYMRSLYRYVMVCEAVDALRAAERRKTKPHVWRQLP